MLRDELCVLFEAIFEWPLRLACCVDLALVVFADFELFLLAVCVLLVVAGEPLMAELVDDEPDILLVPPLVVSLEPVCAVWLPVVEPLLPMLDPVVLDGVDPLAMLEPLG